MRKVEWGIIECSIRYRDSYKCTNGRETLPTEVSILVALIVAVGQAILALHPNRCARNCWHLGTGFHDSAERREKRGFKRDVIRSFHIIHSSTMSHGTYFDARCVTDDAPVLLWQCAMRSSSPTPAYAIRGALLLKMFHSTVPRTWRVHSLILAWSHSIWKIEGSSPHYFFKRHRYDELAC